MTAVTPTEQGQRQLETLRDTLLTPHLELIERQQVMLTEQAERIGRLAAERDALHARLSAQEAQQVEPPAQTSNTLETATDAATNAPWWKFWK